MALNTTLATSSICLARARNRFLPRYVVWQLGWYYRVARVGCIAVCGPGKGTRVNLVPNVALLLAIKAKSTESSVAGFFKPDGLSPAGASHKGSEAFFELQFGKGIEAFFQHAERFEHAKLFLSHVNRNPRPRKFLSSGKLAQLER